MLHYEIKVGRLLELRLPPTLSVPEMVMMRGKGIDLVMNSPRPLVACVDARHGHIYPPEIAEGLVAFMKVHNPNIDRTAVVVTDGAVFSLQAERMLREANNPHRRAFRSVAEARSWLGEVLDAAERARLLSFLD